MKKKGISPLIATVLIIGFTVALAALILNWGQTFTQDIQDTTSESGEQQLTCATDVVFELQNACQTVGNNLKLTVANNGALDLEALTIRAYASESLVDTFEITSDKPAYATQIPLTAFDIESYEIMAAELPSVAGNVHVVEIIPQIIVGDEIVSCAATISDFGSFGGNALESCI